MSFGPCFDEIVSSLSHLGFVYPQCMAHVWSSAAIPLTTGTDATLILPTAPQCGGPKLGSRLGFPVLLCTTPLLILEKFHV